MLYSSPRELQLSSVAVAAMLGQAADATPLPLHGLVRDACSELAEAETIEVTLKLSLVKTREHILDT
jgi:hypothetical protein